MSIETTISTHFGTQAHRAHNIRDERTVKNQSHIDPNGEHEIWYDKPIDQAYHEIFDKALNDYNEKQKREDRKIPNYLEKVKHSKMLHPVYETITQIGNKDTPIPPEEQKEMLRQYFNDWKEANPNMILIGAYWHNDEKGGMHLHSEFIPVAYNCSRGLETQTNLTKAIEQQDRIKTIKRSKEKPITAQSQWQRKENERLERIVQSRGYRVIHPERDKNPEHQETRIYKAQQDLDKKEQVIEQREQAIEKREEAYQRDLQTIREAKETASKIKTAGPEKSISTPEPIERGFHKGYYTQDQMEKIVNDFNKSQDRIRALERGETSQRFYDSLEQRLQEANEQLKQRTLESKAKAYDRIVKGGIDKPLRMIEKLREQNPKEYDRIERLIEREDRQRERGHER